MEENEPYTGLNDPEPEPTPEPQPEPEAPEVEEPAPTAEPEPEQLTDKEKALLAKAQDEKRKRQALEQKVAELEQKQQKPEPQPEELPHGIGPKPALEQFDSYEDWVEALSDWKTDVKLARRDQQAQQREAATKRQQADAKARESYADFDEVMESLPQVAMSQVAIDSIVESDHSADLLYHFGKNPDEAERISRMTPVQQVKAIGRLESQFDKKPEPKPAPTPPRRVTQAPEPVAPVGVKNNVPPDPDNMSDEDWLKHERERLRKQGRLY